MNDGTKGTLTIRYINGTEQRFEYPRLEETYNIVGRMQEILKSNQALLELGDSLLIIPFQNIQSIEISPPPDKLPTNALRNVRLLT